MEQRDLRLWSIVVRRLWYFVVILVLGGFGSVQTLLQMLNVWNPPEPVIDLIELVVFVFAGSCLIVGMEREHATEIRARDEKHAAELVRRDQEYKVLEAKLTSLQAEIDAERARPDVEIVDLRNITASLDNWIRIGEAHFELRHDLGLKMRATFGVLHHARHQQTACIAIDGWDSDWPLMQYADKEKTKVWYRIGQEGWQTDERPLVLHGEPIKIVTVNVAVPFTQLPTGGKALALLGGLTRLEFQLSIRTETRSASVPVQCDAALLRTGLQTYLQQIRMSPETGEQRTRDIEALLDYLHQSIS